MLVDDLQQPQRIYANRVRMNAPLFAMRWKRVVGMSLESKQGSYKTTERNAPSTASTTRRRDSCFLRRDAERRRSPSYCSKNSGNVMAGQRRKARMKQVPLSKVKDGLSRYVRLAAKEEVVITHHGKPAAVLVHF